MIKYFWDNYSGYDDSVLIPLNLTSQEMVILRSVLAEMDNVDVWDDSFNFYNDVQPLIEVIEFLISDS
jgi:hypothetical protein